MEEIYFYYIISGCQTFFNLYGLILSRLYVSNLPCIVVIRCSPFPEMNYASKSCVQARQFLTFQHICLLVIFDLYGFMLGRPVVVYPIPGCTYPNSGVCCGEANITCISWERAKPSLAIKAVSLSIISL